MPYDLPQVLQISPTSAVGVGLPDREVVRRALVEEQGDEGAQGLAQRDVGALGVLPRPDPVQGEFVLDVRVLVGRQPVGAGRVLR